jgi:diacylglycerol O-acyltransferase / wax synthase
MSGVDAAFLYFETPAMHMHVCGVLVLDPSGVEGFSFQRIREHFASRLVLIPEFRRKLSAASVLLHHPVWVDLIDVPLSEHIHRVEAPAPGGQRELEQVVAEFAEQKLDRSRPLWDVLVVEGLERGRVAVVVKVHHAMVDGVAAGDVLAQLVDITPEGRTAEEVYEASKLVAGRRRGPGVVDTVAHTVKGVASAPVGVAKLVPAAGKSVVKLVKTRRDGASAGGTVPFQGPRAPWNGTVTGRRAVALVDVPIEDVKKVKAAFGGTFNDVMMTVVGGAFRRYLADRGELPDTSLIAVLPVNVRAPGERGGNKTSAMFATLATDVEDPVHRLGIVRAATKAGKAEQKALGNDLIEHAGALVQPLVVSWAARAYGALRLAELHPVIHNLVLSNVPGPPIPLYLAGARVDTLLPLGPVLDGAGLNVTIVSYADRVGVGFIACADSIPDLHELAAGVPEELAALVARV